MSLSVLCFSVFLFFSLCLPHAHCSLPNVRPPPSQRKFNSTVINNFISTFSATLSDPDISTLFTNCFPNTLDTTVEFTHFDVENNIFDTFIITGDIDAMWLRDSMNQIQPYLPFISQEKQLQYLACGLIRRQSYYITEDSYANSFNFNFSGAGNHLDDRRPKMSALVFEGKYELDSIISLLKLSRQYYQYSNGDFSCYDLGNTNSTWILAIQKIILTIEQQMTPTNSPNGAGEVYSFQRVTTSATETLSLGGVGVIVPGNIGLIRSQFRASDDSTTFPYNIPENAFASLEMLEVSNVIKGILSTPNVKKSIPQANINLLLSLQSQLFILSQQVEAAIELYGVVRIPPFITLPLPSSFQYAYEVDGYGSQYLSDDANIPSLLSLPYLGYLNRNDSKYLATKTLLMSTVTNPLFFKGTVASGQGSVHTGMNTIWPMAIIMQAWGSDDDTEIASCLNTLKLSSANTGFLHESFSSNDYSSFTRKWFAWVNALFGELIVDLAKRKPHLVLKQ